MTQYDKIIKLLKEAGEKGINSYDRWSVAYQLPARIFYLKRSPYNLDIQTKRNKDGSVTYILKDKPKPTGHWETNMQTGMARWVEDQPVEPVQLQII